MQVEGYVGICRICFCPVEKGEATQLPGSDTYYHKTCVQKNPNSYYYYLEKLESEFNAGADPKVILGKLIEKYTIPDELSEDFISEHPDVINLYKQLI